MSFCSWRGWVSLLRGCPFRGMSPFWGGLPSKADGLLFEGDLHIEPPRQILSTGSWYASYWNAILSFFMFTLDNLIFLWFPLYQCCNKPLRQLSIHCCNWLFLSMMNIRMPWLWPQMKLLPPTNVVAGR